MIVKSHGEALALHQTLDHATAVGTQLRRYSGG
jgi:hypothetical protein